MNDGKSVEITPEEITPEMIEAGARVLIWVDSDSDLEWVAERVYYVMSQARVASKCQQP